MASSKVVAFNRGGPQGGLEAGQHGRRLRAIPTSAMAINSAIRTYGRTALARSRFLCINNPLMVQAKEEYVAALIGDGIKPNFTVPDPAVKDDLQETWLDWTDESDADNLTDFYGQQVMAGSEMFEAGECFIRLRPRLLTDGFTVPLQIQLLPSEMCPVWHNQALPNGRRIECGVQFSPIGVREGYWFFRSHPGEQNFTNANIPAEQLYFIPAEQILHLFKPIRAGQIRGIPHTLAGIITVALMDLYDDAELERKRTAALFSAFITRKVNESEGDNPLGGGTTTPNNATTGQVNTGMEPGATVELTDGQDIKFAEPADVGGNYEAFQYRNLLRAAAGVGVPYASMSGDLKGANYGSQRAGMLGFKRRISVQQNMVFIFQFCRPIKDAWLKAGVIAKSFKTFNATKYLANPRQFGKRVRWITPKWDWIDPLKDISAEKLAVDSGFKARSDVIEAMGDDAAATDARIAADQKRADDLDLSFITVSTGIVVSPNGDTNSQIGLDPNLSPANDPPSKPRKSKSPPPKPAARRSSARFSWDR